MQQDFLTVTVLKYQPGKINEIIYNIDNIMIRKVSIHKMCITKNNIFLEWKYNLPIYKF